MTVEAGKITRAVTLFISHASEDKVAFVDPLVEALRDHFQLWYDKDSLIPGRGSLLKQISEGLRKTLAHRVRKRWLGVRLQSGAKPQTRRRADLSSVQLLPSLDVEMAHPSTLDA